MNGCVRALLILLGLAAVAVVAYLVTGAVLEREQALPGGHLVLLVALLKPPSAPVL